MRYLWEWFAEISACRPVSQAGMLPVPATEIRAWEDLRRIRLEPWEVDVLRGLDALFLRINAADRAG
uniref:phage tail assembly chaperone n=1 Tax=Acidiphilium angustum TaxID=523 RepID=UPI0004946418|nr:hypothetical protein [Acidiphilium angustum]